MQFEDEGLEGREGNVVREVEGSSGGDVDGLETGGCAGRVKELGVAGNIEDGGLGGAVDNCDYSVSVEAASHDINAVPRAELSCVAPDDGLVTLTPMKQVA